MRCERAQEVFSEYLEGTMQPPLALALRRHLQECADCEHAYEQFEATWRMLDGVPAVEPPPQFKAALLATLAEQRAQRRAPSWQLGWQSIVGMRVPVRAFAVAAAAVLFLALAVQMGPQKPTVSTTVTPRVGIDLPDRTAATAQVAVARQDGASGLNAYSISIAPAERVPVLRTAVYSLAGWDGSTTPVADRASVIADQVVRQGLQATVVYTLNPRSMGQESTPLLVQWVFRGDTESRLVFLPAQTMGNPIRANGPLTAYQALRLVSARYAAVIVADSKLSGTVRGVALDGPVDDALNSLSSSLKLEWKRTAKRHFVVEAR